MAPSGHILETKKEETRREPAGIVQYVQPRKISVLRDSGLEVIGVEADDAAIVDVAARKQHGVIEEEGREIVGRDVASQFSGANWGAVIDGEGRGEKQAPEGVGIERCQRGLPRRIDEEKSGVSPLTVRNGTWMVLAVRSLGRRMVC
jgi:hypothetical protein